MYTSVWLFYKDKLSLIGKALVYFHIIYSKEINKHMYLEHFQTVVKLFLVCPKVQYSGHTVFGIY